MNKNDEILARLMSIEATNDEIYKELIKLQRDMKNRKFEELQLRVLVEDIYDYIRIIGCEKNISEKVETKEKMWYSFAKMVLIS